MRAWGVAGIDKLPVLAWATVRHVMVCKALFTPCSHSPTPSSWLQANFQNSLANVSSRPANAPERKGGADPFSRKHCSPKPHSIYLQLYKYFISHQFEAKSSKDRKNILEGQTDSDIPISHACCAWDLFLLHCGSPASYRL